MEEPTFPRTGHVVSYGILPLRLVPSYPKASYYLDDILSYG